MTKEILKRMKNEEYGNPPRPLMPAEKVLFDRLPVDASAETIQDLAQALDLTIQASWIDQLPLTEEQIVKFREVDTSTRKLLNSLNNYYEEVRDKIESEIELKELKRQENEIKEEYKAAKRELQVKKKVVEEVEKGIGEGGDYARKVMMRMIISGNRGEVKELLDKYLEERIKEQRLKDEKEKKEREIKEAEKRRREKETDLEKKGLAVRFKTWWNNNCATVIRHYDDYYQVFLLVYEPEKTNRTGKVKQEDEVFIFPKNRDCEKWGKHQRNKHRNLSDTQKEAEWLRNKLTNDSEYCNNPILIVIDPYEKISIDDLFSKPYVLEKEIPCKIETRTYTIYVNSPTSRGYDCKYIWGGIWEEYREIKEIIYPGNPDNYLKPLDVVKVENYKKSVNYFHFAIYLGKWKVCHITSDNQGAQIESWNKFLNGASGKLYKYHLPVPFKKWEDTVRHIAKTVTSNYKKGEYNLCNDNCEHYSWEQITGIDYSRQAMEWPPGTSLADWLQGRGDRKVRHRTSVDLPSEIRSSSQKFDNLKSSDDYQAKNKISEIKGSEREWQTRIEVPPKDCDWLSSWI